MKKTFKTFALMLLTAFAFSSCVDVPAPFNVPDKGNNSEGGGTTVEPQGEGTATSPFNVAAAVAMIKEMPAGEESASEYYIKGKVLAVTTTAETISQYGNHTFTMVDEGTSSPVFTAFQVYGPGKKKFTSVDDVKAGDEVIVCGKVVNYRGNTPETVGKGAAYVVSINSAGGSGEDDDIQHISIAEFLQKADVNTTYELTGTVRNITNTTYGNFDLVEGDASIYIYGLLNLNGEKQKFASIGIEEGDIVTLTGKYKLYNNKPEIENAQLISFNKGDGGETPPVEGTPVTCAEAVDLTNALADGASSPETYTITGYITQILGAVSTQTGSPQQSFWMSDEKGGNNQFQAYYANLPEGVSAFAVGMKVKITGQLLKYVNNSGQVTPEIKNADVVILEQGGDTPGPTPGPGGDEVTELVNGGFEEWVSDAEPLGWKSASTASNATLSKSTEARSGSFACQIAAPGTGNKRLATQEITLEAGNYTFSFYAKSTTANICQTRAGYVPVNGTTVGTYKYGDYVDINNNGWTLVTYDFTLDSATTLCLLVMNPKDSDYSKSQNVLIDDATLVKK